MLHFHKQRAAAMIMALMIMAVVATLSTAMMVSQHLLIVESGMVQNNDSVYQGVQLLEDLAKQRLLNDWLKGKGKIYKASQQIAPYSYKGAVMSGRLLDLNGFFNLNMLSKSRYIPHFAALLMATDNNFSKKEALSLSKKIYEWTLAHSQYNPYEHYSPPYQPAGQLLSHYSELRLVAGVSAPLMQKLVLYTSAFPKKSKININAASAPVIMSLLTPMNKSTREEADAFIKCRKEVGLIKSAKTLAKCTNSLSMKGVVLDSSLVGYTSHYFAFNMVIQLKGRVYRPMAVLVIDTGQDSKNNSQALASHSRSIIMPRRWPKINILWQKW